MEEFGNKAEIKPTRGFSGMVTVAAPLEEQVADLRKELRALAEEHRRTKDEFCAHTHTQPEGKVVIPVHRF